MIKTPQELYKIFSICNKSLFDNKLEEPIILIASKRKTILGTCSVNRIWLHKSLKKDIKAKYEITISAENLNRTTHQITATMIHEMVHLYNALNNVKDTSNNYVYHNKNFKLEAEKRGLIIEKADSIGWSLTTLQEQTIKLIDTFKIDETAFEYFRESFSKTSSRVKSIRNKYKCTKCEFKISSSKELNLICGDCKVALEKF